ncbi:MAG: hypothetical protein ACP5O1_09660 [Phycisphaerae bacterium]
MIRLPESFPRALGDWLFLPHPLVYLAMAVVAVAFIWRWWHTRHTRLLIAGAGIFAATLIWAVMAWLVVTPGERLRGDLQQILSDAAHQDVVGIEQFLAPDVVFNDENRAGILSELNYRLSQVRITANYLRSIHMRRRGRSAQTNIVVLSIARNYGPLITRWRLIWRDHARPGHWQITQMQLQGMSNSQINP